MQKALKIMNSSRVPLIASMMIVALAVLDITWYLKRRAHRARRALRDVENKLREEFSCKICFKVCLMPCTNHCGHSFCRKCLSERCPECGEFMSNEGIVNETQWKIILRLLPLDVEARIAAERATTQEEDEDATLAINESASPICPNLGISPSTPKVLMTDSLPED